LRRGRPLSNEFTDTTGTVRTVVQVGGSIQHLSINVLGLPFQVRRTTRLRSGVRIVAITVAFTAAEWVLWLLHGQASPGADRAIVLAVMIAFAPVVSIPLTVAYRGWELASGRYDTALPERMKRATHALASALREELNSEQRLRRLQDPFPLPLRWANADRLADHWEAIKQNSRDGTPIDLEGSLDESSGLPGILDVFRKVPSRRLVITGPAGAGKSVLAMRFAADLLDRRDGGADRRVGEEERVPVILPVASWPSGQPLPDWIAGRLAIDHPELAAAGRPDTTLAYELVRAGTILAILDGFDELPRSRRPDALKQLNRALDAGTPVILTTRAAEYEQAIAAGDVLTRSAVIAIAPLTPDDLALYLPLTTKPQAKQKWTPVLNQLPDNTELRAVLQNPLMTSLARAAYSDTPADPAELLGERLQTRNQLEDHLLRQFVPSVYEAAAAKAHKYLSYLARDATRNSPAGEIAWWRLADRTPRLGQVMLLVTYVAVVAVVAHFTFAQAAAESWGIAAWQVVALACLPALLLGFVSARTPAPVRLSLHSQRVITLLLTLAAGLLLATAWLITKSFPVPVLYAVGAVCLVLAIRWTRVPGDVTSASTPRDLLRSDRRAALTVSAGNALTGDPGQVVFGLILWTPVLVLSAWASAGGAGGMASGTWLATAVASAVLFVAYGMACTAWGCFSWSRVLLAATGQLPWRTMRFLEDAHRRGVLRQSGASYQFRHARLRERLASGASYQWALRPQSPAARFPILQLAAAVIGVTVAAVEISLVPGPPGPYRAGLVASRVATVESRVQSLPGWANTAQGPCKASTAAGGGAAETSCDWKRSDSSGNGFFTIPKDDLSLVIDAYYPAAGQSAVADATGAQSAAASNTNYFSNAIAGHYANYPRIPSQGGPCDWSTESTATTGNPAFNFGSQGTPATAALQCQNLEIKVTYDPATGTGSSSATVADQVMILVTRVLAA
jgi:NACHT domain-containing protein